LSIVLAWEALRDYQGDQDQDVVRNNQFQQLIPLGIQSYWRLIALGFSSLQCFLDLVLTYNQQQIVQGRKPMLHFQLAFR
jgi:hypothetical protein